MLLSVEQVADQLGLHVRTVRNYIRDGKLDAVRIGKQYRIRREDLDAFTGADLGQRQVEVSSIVQVDAIDRSGADRLSAQLRNSLEGSARARVESAYDEDRGCLKLIVLGDPEATAELLQLISLLTRA